MEPKVITGRGALTESRRLFVNDEWVTSTQTFAVPSMAMGVQPGISKKGDFKTPTCPWSYTITETDFLRGTCTGRSSVTPDYTNLIGYLLPHPATSWEWTSIVQEARDSARSKAVEALNDSVRGSLDLAVSIAEAGQTDKMINLVRRFTDGMAYSALTWKRTVLRNLASFKRKRSLQKYLRRWQRDIKARYPGSYRPIKVDQGLISKISSNLANGWLEFTYGWKPLMADIYGVASNVVGQVKNSLNLFTVRKTVRFSEGYPISTMVLNRTHYGEAKVSGVAMHTFGLRLKREDPLLARWTSMNPAAIAYELLPFSFVFDWFVDLGGYMRNMETALRYGSSFLSGYTSTFTKVLVQSRFGSSSRTGTYIEDLVAVGSIKETRYMRDSLDAYPTPTFPSFQVDLGSSRLLSAASLLRQLIRR